MKKQLGLVLLTGWLAGCSTTTTYTPSQAAGPARPLDYPMPIYNQSTRIPRPCKLIGELYIGDTQLTLFGGSLDGVMKTLMETAHQKGADVVQILDLKEPDFESAHYRLDANLLRYADDWETVPWSESDLIKYLQTRSRSLDPIEGIWSDGSPERIGIIRNTAKPGRDFIAFTLNPPLASWHKGYKKMEIARAERPGDYSLIYYRDDFGAASTSFLLSQNRTFGFIINAYDHASEITFSKVMVPMPVEGSVTRQP